MARENRVIYFSPVGFFNHGPVTIFKKVFEKLGRSKKEGEGPRYEEPEKLERVTLKFIPWHNNGLIERINKRMLLKQVYSALSKYSDDNSEIVFWSGNPCRTVFQLSDDIKPKVIVYDNAMRFEELPGASRYVLKHEEEAVKKSTFIISDNEYKKNEFEAWSSNVYKLPQGVDTKKFDATKEYELPDELKSLKKPIIGYFGSIQEVFDYHLYEHLLDSNPEFSFVAIGPANENEQYMKIKSYENFTQVPAVEHHELARYLANFDVALIPYVVNDYTKGTFPTKLFEYLSFSKAVVAEPIDELKQFEPYVYLSADKEEFSQYIREAVQNGAKKNPEEMQKLIRDNSWESRYKRIENIFEAL
ncbi:glycosyltransferase [Patescibacteria group bacterium]